MTIKGEKRNYGIDLVRIVSMVMIVMGHIIVHGGISNGGGTALRYFAYLRPSPLIVLL